MKHAKKAMAAGLLTAASLGLNQPAAHAVTYAEVGDAGQTLATAQFTAASPAASGQSLTAISGALSSFTDADLYEFTITSTTTFSAAATSALDTSLFLFNSAGVAVIAEDDQSGTNFQGAIPAGNTLLTTLGAGTYYLGISLSGNEPVNSANQLLFTTDQPTTNVRGTATGLNPTTESTFNGGTFYNESGTYSIALTGAATLVPEPSTYASLLVGAGALACFLRRRRVA